MRSAEATSGGFDNIPRQGAWPENQRLRLVREKVGRLQREPCQPDAGDHRDAGQRQRSGMEPDPTLGCDL